MHLHIVFQFAENGETSESKTSSEGEDGKNPVDDLKDEVTNGSGGLRGLNDSRGMKHFSLLSQQLYDKWIEFFLSILKYG